MTQDLANVINQAWEARASLSAAEAPATVRDAVEHVIAALDAGTLRVAEKAGDTWVVHEWIKKAVLLSFRLHDNAVLGQAPLQYFDKVPTKFAGHDAAAFQAAGVRVVPPPWRDAALSSAGMSFSCRPM